MIENEQREGLESLELALFIQKRLQAGETRAEIAQRLGILEFYELRRLHDDHPDEVERWIAPVFDEPLNLLRRRLLELANR